MQRNNDFEIKIRFCNDKCPIWHEHFLLTKEMQKAHIVLEWFKTRLYKQIKNKPFSIKWHKLIQVCMGSFYTFYGFCTYISIRYIEMSEIQTKKLDEKA